MLGDVRARIGVLTRRVGGVRLEMIRKSLANTPLLEIEGDIDHASAGIFDRAVRELS